MDCDLDGPDIAQSIPRRSAGRLEGARESLPRSSPLFPCGDRVSLDKLRDGLGRNAYCPPAIHARKFAPRHPRSNRGNFQAQCIGGLLDSQQLHDPIYLRAGSCLTSIRIVSGDRSESLGFLRIFAIWGAGLPKCPMLSPIGYESHDLA